MGCLRFSDILAKVAEVDDEAVAEKAESDPALRAALEMTRPENWWGSGASQDLLRAARAEGLPLAWVPRRNIIKELARASDAAARLDILKQREDEVLEDCLNVLDECDDEDIRGTAELARLAVEAVKGGHHQAGMALAVSIGEQLAVWASTPRVKAFESKEDREAWEAKRVNKRHGGKYRYAQIEIDRLGPMEEVPVWHFNYQVLIAPIPRFFTPFWGGSGESAPAGLSRHVVAHRPSPEHFNRTNALLAVMLVASILREQQSWIEEVRE